MQLKSIKLSGFKSFADSTLLPFKQQICAIVGPNGCGKSNIVDAMRWVIGEGSAKQLRMQSMAEVIFNGTNNRQPMGMASVELNFDNSDHSLVGEYAHYTDLSIRRSVERDGASNYYINNSPCRRRDIIDIFLGTGLGPRSYAVIEQGMISRLIEAKDQELRAYLEEAAGISKYKERRRETENRLRHTNENLERLHDIIEEHAKQQRHLKRQANAAERYKVLKAEERQLSAECLAIEYQGFASEISNYDIEIAQADTSLDAKKSEKSALDNNILCLRASLEKSQTQMQAVQKRYYDVGAEVAKLEQQIAHYRSQYNEWQNNLSQLLEQCSQIDAACAEHDEQIQLLSQERESLMPRQPEMEENLRNCNSHYEQADAKLELWRERWADYQAQLAEKQREISVCETKKQHAATDLRRLETRKQQLQSIIERAANSELETRIDKGLAMQAELEAESGSSAARADELRTEIDFARDSLTEQQEKLHAMQQELQTTQSRKEALQVIIDNTIDTDQQAWLNANGLGEKPRLAQILQIEAGWEHAIEIVLAPVLNSICVDNCIAHQDLLANGSTLRLYINKTTTAAQPGTLSSFVSSDCIPVELNNVYIADSAAAAWEMLDSLADNESVITKDCLWLSKFWARSLSLDNNESNNSQILCAKEIKALQAKLPGLEESINSIKLDLEQSTAKLRELEASREDSYQAARDANAKLTSVNSNLSRLQAENDELKRAAARAQSDLDACIKDIDGLSTTEIDNNLVEMRNSLDDYRSKKDTYQFEAEQLKDSLAQARNDQQDAKRAVDEFDLRLKSNQDQLQLLRKMSERDSAQSIVLNERAQSMRVKLDETDSPLPAIESNLQDKIKSRLEVENELRTVEESVNVNNNNLRDLETAVEKARRILDDLNANLQQIQMRRQEQVVRQATVKEQLIATDSSLDDVISGLPDAATLTDWRERLAAKERSISRLGPINMAAIEEYDAITERKEHLDAQNADLQEAIKLLDQAIAKIDRETKDKFKATFNAANENLQKLFPKVFSGGRAYLELTEPDWLNAGVIIWAQPPGKKNSTIHMLSGGEKALTAIALVFSLFSLNPAPFCVLDEVDAPLDDSNVSRFCRLVQEMSSKTQFVVVSHNKVSINMAQQLLGVTMQEPGVSRIVAVDMHDAVAMAEA